MTRGGWQVRERKARQAAKASRISGPLSILPPPSKAITKSTTSCPAPDSVPLALSADSSPRSLEFSDSVAPAAAMTTTPVSPLAPNSLNDTLIDGSSPPAIAAAATASSTSSAPINSAAPIELSQITATPFDAVISTHSDPSFLEDPAPGKKLNKRARRKVAEAAAAAAAALESSPTGGLSGRSGDANLVQFNSNQPLTSEELEQTAATAEQLGAEMRRLFLVSPEAEGYESDEKGEAPQQQREEEGYESDEKGETPQQQREEEGYESDKKGETPQQQREEEGHESDEEGEAPQQQREEEGYQSDEKGEAPQQQREEEEEEEEDDLESITAKITAFWQAIQNDAKVPLQNYGGLQSGQDQRVKELQEAIMQAEMRIADFQSHTAQAHEDLFSFMTHQLAKQEEASKNASHASARIIALLIFCNCAFLGLLIAPYL